MSRGKNLGGPRSHVTKKTLPPGPSTLPSPQNSPLPPSLPSSQPHSCSHVLTYSHSGTRVLMNPHMGVSLRPNRSPTYEEEVSAFKWMEARLPTDGQQCLRNNRAPARQGGGQHLQPFPYAWRGTYATQLKKIYSPCVVRHVCHAAPRSVLHSIMCHRTIYVLLRQHWQQLMLPSHVPCSQHTHTCPYLCQDTLGSAYGAVSQ